MVVDSLLWTQICVCVLLAVSWKTHFPHPRLTGSATHAGFYLPVRVSQQFRLCIPKQLRLALISTSDAVSLRKAGLVVNSFLWPVFHT